MKEIECKILAIDRKRMLNKLASLGLRQQGDPSLIVEQYYDYPDGRITKRGDVLRLRKYGERTELVYKSEKRTEGIFKVAEETETEVDDFDVAATLLAHIGLQRIIHREKRRTILLHGDVEIAIDEYPSIPPYLELEGPPAAVERLLGMLDIKESATTTMTSTEVLRSYGMEASNLTFGGKRS